MIVYHGTTDRRARRICEEGFLPRKPSRRVWFARGKGYALRRATTQARRSHDHPVVLTCNIDVTQLKARVGPKRVFYGNGILAVKAHVPVSVLRGAAPEIGQPTSPEELAEWANRLLGLKPWKGVGRHHPGIERLSRDASGSRVSGLGSAVVPMHGTLADESRGWDGGCRVDQSLRSSAAHPPVIQGMSWSGQPASARRWRAKGRASAGVMQLSVPHQTRFQSMAMGRPRLL